MASPKFFYQISQSWLKSIACLAFLFLMIGVIWGLFFAPPDYQQGDAFRIIYLHVPAAFLSMALYSYMAFCALLLLVWRIKLAGLLMSVTAKTGLWMAFLALLTGSIWGKPMWGTWWIWDARLTSELVLLFLYAAILVMQSAFNNKQQADKMTAILVLVGLVDLPIIHYSVYWWNTLHQGASITLLAKPTIAASMLYPLIFTTFGFALFCLWAILHHAGNTLLLREKRQDWVRQLSLGLNK